MPGGAHACNPSILGGRGRQISEFEASLVYRVSSRTARATQRNPVSKNQNSWVVVAHACNPSILGGRGRRISEFEASLVYRVSSRTARVTQRNPVSKKPKKIKNKKIVRRPFRSDRFLLQKRTLDKRIWEIFFVCLFERQGFSV